MLLITQKFKIESFILIFILSVFSCDFFEKKNSGGNVLAKVDDYVLLESDFHKDYSFEGLSNQDSTSLSKDIINKWILKKLLVNKARINISQREMSDINILVEKYREDLLINKYKESLVSQNFNDTVNYDKSLKYYESNKELFKLSNSIVKLNYVLLPSEFGHIDKVVSLLGKSKDTLNDNIIYEIESICYGVTQNFSLDDNNWKKLKNIKNNIPLDEEKDMRQGKILKFKDSNGIWIVKINDYKKSGTTAPFEYVSDKIKNIIHNHRKLDFIKKVETELLETHLKNEKNNKY